MNYWYIQIMNHEEEENVINYFVYQVSAETAESCIIDASFKEFRFVRCIDCRINYSVRCYIPWWSIIKFNKLLFFFLPGVKSFALSLCHYKVWTSCKWFVIAEKLFMTGRLKRRISTFFGSNFDHSSSMIQERRQQIKYFETKSSHLFVRSSFLLRKF